MTAAQETYDWLKSICGNVHMVNGDCDDGRAHPDDAVLTIGDLKVGLIHGHQVDRPPATLHPCVVNTYDVHTHFRGRGTLLPAMLQ